MRTRIRPFPIFWIVLIAFFVGAQDPPVWFGFADDANFETSLELETLRMNPTLHLALSVAHAEYLFETFGQRSILLTHTVMNLTSLPVYLYPNWNEIWDALALEVAPLLDDGTLIGLVLGDELIWHCMPPSELEALANAVRATFPDTIIWENEAFPIFTDQISQCGDLAQPFVVPSALSWFSLDIYHMDGPDASFVADVVRVAYDAYVFANLQPHQRAVLIPGSFSSNNNPLCDEDCYIELCQIDAAQFVDWAVTDDRVVAVVAWHWESCWGYDCVASFSEVGTKDLPDLFETWVELSPRMSIRAGGSVYWPELIVCAVLGFLLIG